MNFNDIEAKHIIEFLTLNHIFTNKDIYKIAIDLINNTDIEIIFTKPIQHWLTAFELKNQVKLTKDSEIRSEYQLFNVDDKQDVIAILKYLKCYIDDSNYFCQLPYDLLTEILCYVELKPFKQLSRSIYNYYKKVISDGWFRKRKCELMLMKKGYTDMNLFNIDYIYKALVPAAGNVVYVNKNINLLNFYEPVVKILTIKNLHTTIVLTKAGKLLVYNNDFSVTNLNMMIDDVLFFNNTYYFLSGGKIYYGFFHTINRFSYEGRSMNSENNLKILTINNIEVDNVFSMCCTNHDLLFLKTNGQVYNLNELIVDQVLQIAATKHQYYILLSNGQLYNHILDIKIKKLIGGRVCFLLGDACYRIDKYNTLTLIPNIKAGIYKKRGVYINNQVEIHDDKINYLDIQNPINLFHGHYDDDFYVIID